eukprot:GAHX01000612.1.p1 GENE.GAHX01000612.1~~GAHX01000612.1.p1  ORF type:complete len:466 (+),score=88.65 GAHX01000612.1:53-1450(+)
MTNTASVVFIGHVDSGKSTTCGQILIGAGEIDKRTLQKYEELAAKNNRETWWIAYLMDASDEERARGKTVELGSASFTLKPSEHSKDNKPKQFVIWDAPGHKNYVSNMVAGVFLADVAVLIISARLGEFEAGFEKGGQTREHAFLAKASGISKLVIAVNKMDDPSVNWNQARFAEIKVKITKFLKSFGFKGEKSLVFVPMSGQTGENVFQKCTQGWYKDKTLMEVFEEIHENTFSTEVTTDEKVALVSILDSDKDATKLTNIGVKLLKGNFNEGDELYLPGYKTNFLLEKISPFIESIEKNENQTHIKESSVCRFNLKMLDNNDIGMDNKKIKLKEMDILCNKAADLHYPVKCEAKFKVVQICEDKPLLTTGFTYTIYTMTGQSECEFTRFRESETGESTTNEKKRKRIKCVLSGQTVDATFKITGKNIVMKENEINKSLARFVVREGNTTIGVGIVTKVIKVKE